jgi:iron-sulfur cluster assembly protein
MDFTITERAASKLRHVAQKEGIDLSQTYLRVAVVPGGCSGLTYDLGWDTVRQETDRYAEAAGLRLLMDRRSFLYVEGTELDFSDGLEGKGFHFLNPQAARTCACGESFGL